ncbi:ABC transporter substrate-binding protein [Pseudomonas sp.]|uniref:substrate-binding periplasmic protein n=1 Tax=Pseudomonas sp. TaxID=306 RepID=UPI00262E4574|nr:transporter substrate-binding domain-containing protein [Pseudomonas sp.]
MKIHMSILAAGVATICSLLTQSATALNCPSNIRVGISDRGYASFRSNNGYEGISVDLFTELSKRTGCKVTFVWLPSVRLMLELEAGQIDISATMIQDAKRDQFAVFLPYAYSQSYLVLLKRQEVTYSSLDEFVASPNTRLNRVRGLLMSKKIEDMLKPMLMQGRVEHVNDFATVFRKLDAGRAEAAVMTPWIYLWHARQAGISDQLVLVPIREVPSPMLGMYVSSSSMPNETTSAIAIALESMVKDGSIKAIHERYLPPPIVAQLFARPTTNISAYLLGLQAAKKKPVALIALQ